MLCCQHIERMGGECVEDDETNMRTNIVGIAAELGHHECLNTLIEVGADVNNGSEVAWCAPSPLILTCLNGHDKCVKLILEAGADVNYSCPDYDTALVTAAGKGHDKCVKMLLNRNLFNAGPKRKNEPEKLNVEVNQVLEHTHVNGKRKGNENKNCEAETYTSHDDDDDDAQTIDDKTKALIRAVENDHCVCVELLTSAEIVANYTCKDRDGIFLLNQAAINGCEKCVNLLITVKAKVNWIAAVAEERRNAGCIDFLLQAGAQVDADAFLSGLLPMEIIKCWMCS